MALIVEDGTGIPAANTYASISDADEYFIDTTPSWAAASVADKTAALIKATRYVDGRYRSRFGGVKVKHEQGLEWPRYEAFDRDGYYLSGLPKEAKRATCEAALIALTEDLAPALERGGRVASEKLGPLETSYEAGAPAETVYSSIDRVIAPVLCPSGIRVSR